MKKMKGTKLKKAQVGTVVDKTAGFTNAARYNKNPGGNDRVGSSGDISAAGTAAVIKKAQAAKKANIGGVYGASKAPRSFKKGGASKKK